MGPHEDPLSHPGDEVPHLGVDEKEPAGHGEILQPAASTYHPSFTVMERAYAAYNLGRR